MPVEIPAGPRYRIAERPGELSIIIPASRLWFIIPLLLVWLLFWAFGEVFGAALLAGGLTNFFGAGDDIGMRVAEYVTDVQRPGDRGRRRIDRECLGARTGWIVLMDAGGFPHRLPAFLGFLGIEMLEKGGGGVARLARHGVGGKATGMLDFRAHGGNQAAAGALAFAGLGLHAGLPGGWGVCGASMLQKYSCSLQTI